MKTEERLQVSFSQTEDHIGWIYMDVALAAPPSAEPHESSSLRTSRARMSFVYCPFRELFNWMESVDRVVDPAVVKWEDEGALVELVYVSGRLRFKNRGHEGWWSVDIPAADVARVFYTAFREFVRTTYDRTRFETLHCLREVFLNQLRGRQTLTDLLLPISAMRGEDAARAFAALTQGHYDLVTVTDPDGTRDLATRRCDTLLDPQVIRDWDASGRNRRMRTLRRLLNSRVYFRGSRTNLKSLRSKRIERKISAHMAAQRSA